MKKIFYIIITITFLALLHACTNNTNDDIIKNDQSSTDIAEFPENCIANEEAQTELDVILESFDPAKKLNVIKAVKAATGLGLKEAMAIVTGAPQVVKEGVSKAYADKLIDAINADGGKVSKR